MEEDYFAEIVHYLSTIMAPYDMKIVQKKQIVVKASYYQFISGKSYKLGVDGMLR